LTTARDVQRVSIYTVAKVAGVSYATVSRVFNNHPSVNADTRRRVLEAARELGYAPSLIARGLSKRTTAALGIIIPGISDPFFMPIAQSIEHAARHAGLATLLHDTGRSPETALAGADVLAQFRVSGVIVLGGSEKYDAEIAQRLKGIPTVVVLRQAANDFFPSVYLDHVHGARVATEHLLQLGRRRIAFVSGDSDSVAARDRLQGYQVALSEAGLNLNPALVCPGHFTLDGGAAATQQLLDLPTAQRPDAIFYASDAMALAGLHCLHQQGVRIPQEIAVVGFGNTAFAAISEPTLTTIDVARERMGYLAFDLLERSRQNPEVAIANVQVETTLIVRASTVQAGS
jgi:DNA-binding LacI/PurR family transcriptional regulator